MKRLQDSPIPTRLKLSALWAATMFCYVYGDYFGLYRPGKLASIAQGSIGPIGSATPYILVIVSLMMAIPSLMVASALFTRATFCRWSNVTIGLLYTAIIAISMPGAQPFYITLGVIEMFLTISIMFVAWNWPASRGEDK